MAERDRQWIVPRRNDGDDSERVIHQIAALGFRSGAVVRNALGAKGARSIVRPVFRRIQCNEYVSEKGFHARLAGFPHHSISQFVP